MAVHCVDVSDNKKLAQVSPISMLAFIFIFVLINIFMKLGVLFLIVTVLAFAACQLFFQYSPRNIFLSWRFIFTNAVLTPNFEDEEYVANHRAIRNLLPAIDRPKFEELE